MLKIINKTKKKNGGKPKKIKPNIDNTVTIAIKPYKGDTENGTVKKVLTKKKYHSRGHKVMLKSGKVGRVIKIIKFASKSKSKSKTKSKSKYKSKTKSKTKRKSKSKTKRKCKKCKNHY